jgi:ATP adenylyltransferase/5',5'''-P-1,P-4-tetraphosphate phosphorylase II
MDQLLDLIADTNKSAAQVLREFAEVQKQSWPLAATNYNGLSSVEEKLFQFDGFQVKVQFNPERMQSSAAKVDQASIAERKCFLCNENRPAEQQAIAYGDQFVILVNPYPIFKTHFTISSNTHVDQRFLPNVKAMFEIARAMEGFTVFYNGPECGASAPDHLHFQAGENGFLPVEAEFQQLKSSDNQIFSGQNTQVWAFDQYLRKMISIETDSRAEGLTVIEVFYRRFHELQPEKAEPMLNVLCSFSSGRWVIHLFPRKLHRPWQFFADGNDQLLISPASVDFGGVFTTPRKEDFKKVTKENIEDIFAQVSLAKDSFSSVIQKMKTDMAVIDWNKVR